MSLGTGRVGLYGASARGANIIPQPVVASPGSTTVTVSWAAIDGATGYEVFTGPSATGPWTSKGTTTNLSFVLTGLTASTTTYAAVQATVVSGKGVVTFVTAEPPATVPAYRVISADILPSEYASGDLRCFALRLKNTGAEPITTIRITGRNATSGHAQIQGAWVIGGTLDNANFQGTAWERLLFGGNGTFTPADGSLTSPTFWGSSRLTLATPIPADGEFILRVQMGTGNISGCLDFTSGSRPNFGDLLATGFSGSAGDFGSDATQVQTNPAGGWLGGINGFLASIELGYESATPRPLGIIFSDSVGSGFITSYPQRDGWFAQSDATMAAGRMVNHGVPGCLVEEYCQICRAWLASSVSDIYDTVVLLPWSWNNRLFPDDGYMRPEVIATVSAIQAAGKRAVLWFPVPSCIVGGSPTWTSMLAWAQSSGIPLVETWQAVADGGTGPELTAANTNDGVHLNEVGQAIQGTEFGQEESSVFA